MRASEFDFEPEVFQRDEFARDYFDYEDGQHVLFGGPTQEAGKSTLSFKLLVDRFHERVALLALRERRLRIDHRDDTFRVRRSAGIAQHLRQQGG